MPKRTYSNENLAGILSEALGLESGAGRASFSGGHRTAIRIALEDPATPRTFGELLEALRRTGARETTIEAVERRARAEPGGSLQGFAVEYGRPKPGA